MKKKNRQICLVGVVALVIIVFVIGLTFFGFSQSVNEINEEIAVEIPESVLTSVGVNEDDGINLTVMYYDQRMDKCVNQYDPNARGNLLTRQFEWTKCGYEYRGLEQGMVGFELGKNGVPILFGGDLTSNRGLDNIDRWFNTVDGRSQGHSGNLRLDYEASLSKLSYYDEEFYPLDDVKFSIDDVVNLDGHNHLFTMNFAVPIRVVGNGEERMSIFADDDSFVFIDDKLAIDLGGIHDAIRGELWIRDDGEVYAAVMGQDLAYSGIKLEVGEDTIIKVFHADRDAKNSAFGIDFVGMEPKIINTQIAGTDVVQIAYDPNDLTHVAPLGVSTNSEPDLKRGYVTIVIIYGIVAVMGVMVLMMIVHYLVTNLRKR